MGDNVASSKNALNEMTTTPISLLERLSQPFDPEAWARFVSLYTPMLYSWARGMGAQDDDAADLVQDVFVTLLNVLPTFVHDGQRSFRGYLRKVALNKWRNLQKHADYQRLRSGDAGLDQAAQPDALEARWETEYQQRLIDRALQIMKADFHETTWKAFWEVTVARRPAAAVAAELGISPGAVYASKFRVLMRLQSELRGLVE